MVKITAFLTAITTAVSCGSGQKFTGVNDKETTPFQQDYLTLVGFTGSIVKREKRFSGYSKAAGRISLIDPSTESEVWGRQISGTYDLTAPLPDYTGVALLSGQNLKIVLEHEERTFTPVEFPIGYVARAADAATYAFVSKDGLSVHVVRQIPGGSFQEETFAWPFATPPSFSTPPGDDPPQGVALLSANGSQLIFFHPSDGSYAYYSANDAAGPIEATPKKTCTGVAPSAAPGPALYRALAFDHESSLLVAGDSKGNVSLFDPQGACVAPADRPGQSLGDGLPIIDITVSSKGRYAVTQVGGRLHTFGGTLAGLTDVRTVEGVCSYPLGALPVGPDGMALVCVDAQDLGTAEQKAAAPASVKYSEVSVELVSFVTGGSIFKRVLDVDGTAGAALDPDLSRILILKDSSIGILNVLDLSTGEQHSRKGLFLGGILD